MNDQMEKEDVYTVEMGKWQTEMHKWRTAKQQQQRAIKYRRIAGVILTFLGILMALIGMSIGEIPTDPWPIWGIALQAGWIILGGVVAIFGYRSATDA